MFIQLFKSYVRKNNNKKTILNPPPHMVTCTHHEHTLTDTTHAHTHTHNFILLEAFMFSVLGYYTWQL